MSEGQKIASIDDARRRREERQEKELLADAAKRVAERAKQLGW